MNGKRSGLGTSVYPDPESSTPRVIHYSGRWEDGKMHGPGELTIGTEEGVAVWHHHGKRVEAPEGQEDNRGRGALGMLQPLPPTGPGSTDRVAMLMRLLAKIDRLKSDLEDRERYMMAVSRLVSEEHPEHREYRLSMLTGGCVQNLVEFLCDDADDELQHTAGTP